MEILTIHWTSECGIRSKASFTTKSFMETALLAGVIFSAKAYSRFPNTLGGLQHTDVTDQLINIAEWDRVLKALIAPKYPALNEVSSFNVKFDIVQGGLLVTLIATDDSFILVSGILTIDKYTGSSTSATSKYGDVTMHLHFELADTLNLEVPNGLIEALTNFDGVLSITGKQSSGIKPLLSYYNSPASAGDFQKYHSLSTN